VGETYARTIRQKRRTLFFIVFTVCTLLGIAAWHTTNAIAQGVKPDAAIIQGAFGFLITLIITTRIMRGFWKSL